VPNRIIKESLCESEKISALSDFEFRLWIGLILQADDKGRGDARPAVIKGHVFPFRERVTIKDIQSALGNLAAGGCIDLYDVDGRSYYLFPNWEVHQRIRNVKPKYPEPPCGNLRQSAAICGELRPESESNTNPNTNTKESAHARGEYGWVKLTDKQYEKLVAELGTEETERCIRYIDESAQQTGNKNKWKDWNLTIRKCARDGWGLSNQARKPVAGSRVSTPEEKRRAAERDAKAMEQVKRLREKINSE